MMLAMAKGFCRTCGCSTYKGADQCASCSWKSTQPNEPELNAPKRKLKVLCAGGCGKQYSRNVSEKPPMCNNCRRAQAMRFCAYEPCGKEFRSTTWSRGEQAHRNRFCSRWCVSAERRIYGEPGTPQIKVARSVAARNRKAVRKDTWDGVTDEQIYERDGWVCQVPGCALGLIRRDLPWPDPLSPSIDHIVPLSRGGEDTAVNKRAAHLGCNVVRGNRIGAEDIPEDLQALALEPPPRRGRRKRLSCPVHQDLPWPKAGYLRWCRWCGKQVRVKKRSDRLACCGECSQNGKCSVCGAKVMVVANSRPPETRTCRNCRGAGPSQAPAPREPVSREQGAVTSKRPAPVQADDPDARLWWTSVRPGS